MRHISQAGLLSVFLAAGLAGPGPAVGEAEAPQALPVTTVIFEQNATDGDTEVVFTVKGGDEGLERLTVIAPDGQTVIQFVCPSPVTLGMRQFRFESPEPTDIERLKKAFPAGTYTFEAKTVKGADLIGAANLAHALPPITTIVHPGADAVDIPAGDLRIRWKSVPRVKGYVLEIDQDETEANLTVRLPASSDSFAVPKGFLAPGLEYQLGIGTVTKEGNISFVETTFTTANQTHAGK